MKVGGFEEPYLGKFRIAVTHCDVYLDNCERTALKFCYARAGGCLKYIEEKKARDVESALN